MKPRIRPHPTWLGTWKCGTCPEDECLAGSAKDAYDVWDSYRKTLARKAAERAEAERTWAKRYAAGERLHRMLDEAASRGRA